MIHPETRSISIPNQKSSLTYRVISACRNIFDLTALIGVFFEAAAADLDDLTDALTSYISFCEYACARREICLKKWYKCIQYDMIHRGKVRFTNVYRVLGVTLEDACSNPYMYKSNLTTWETTVQTRTSKPE